MNTGFNIKFILLLIFFALATFNTAEAQGVNLPSNIQAALMSKVLKLNPKLAEKPQIKMLVVYGGNSKVNKEELLSEIQSKNIDAKAVLLTELEQNIKNIDVVYFMPGVQDKTGICKANKVLTITGVAKYVEDGDVSIAFALQNDKPKILVNVTSLKMEDQNLSSDLLRIAKVYK